LLKKKKAITNTSYLNIVWLTKAMMSRQVWGLNLSKKFESQNYVRSGNQCLHAKANFLDQLSGDQQNKYGSSFYFHQPRGTVNRSCDVSSSTAWMRLSHSTFKSFMEPELYLDCMDRKGWPSWVFLVHQKFLKK
jgi:hypothetical protein